MTYTADQFASAYKANVDAVFGLTTKAFEGVEKLVALNLQVAKANLAEATEVSRAALSAKDVQELVALQASLVQPVADKAAAYNRHVYEIFAGASADVTRAAEASMAEGQRKVLALVDTAVKNAPAGSESAVGLVKSAVAAANNAYEAVTKATKQAAEVAEANFQTLTANAVQASKAAAKGARRAA